MTFPRARVVVSACLFLGWIGFLLFLVIDSPKIHLAKPQFLIAPLYVVADIREEKGKADPDVVIDEVVWSAEPEDRERAAKSLRIPNLAACGDKQGFRGAGKYLLPLVKQKTAEAAEFQVAPLPTAGLRIYPWTPETRQQVDRIIASKK